MQSEVIAHLQNEAERMKTIMENTEILRTAPAVFAVGDTYQIMVPVAAPCLMWVQVGEEAYYDDSNGILRSAESTHRMIVPMEELDREKKYTICYRKIIERKPYFTETEDEVRIDFEFRPVQGPDVKAYHIADAHNHVEEPVAAAENFIKKYGPIDFLILNGDIPDHSGRIENFINIYEIVSELTHGNIPTVFSRGNHDTRGIFAEKIVDHTPCQDGHSYYSFRLGNIWGLVLDCGEDKVDSHPEYGNTVCCHAFRKQETRFIRKIIENAEKEYQAEGVQYKVIIVHNPFTRIHNEPFQIEDEIFTEWGRLLREHVKPQVMICGHLHQMFIEEPGSETDYLGHPCRLVVASKIRVRKDETPECYFAGAGFIFSNGEIEAVFTDNMNSEQL